MSGSATASPARTALSVASAVSLMTSPAGAVVATGADGVSKPTTGGVVVSGAVVGNSGVPLAGADGAVIGVACGAAGVSAGSVAGAASSGGLSGASAAGMAVSVSGVVGVATHSHRPLDSMPHCQGSAAMTAEYSASNEATESRRMGVYVTTPGSSRRRGRSVLRSCH